MGTLGQIRPLLLGGLLGVTYRLLPHANQWVLSPGAVGGGGVAGGGSDAWCSEPQPKALQLCEPKMCSWHFEMQLKENSWSQNIAIRRLC